MLRKKYTVDLSEEERTELEEFVSSGTHSAPAITRARILLKADAGAPDRAIADALGGSENTPSNLRKRYMERGLDAVDRTQPDRTYDRRLDGEGHARLIALPCSEPPEGRSSWTLRLLADEFVALEEIDIVSISHETVRQTLKKRTAASSIETVGNSPGGGHRDSIEP